MAKEGGEGIWEHNGVGYGAPSQPPMDASTFAETGSQPWKEKSSKGEVEGTTIACAICSSTLGLVSNHDTYRFYKHRLSCGSPSSATTSNIFAKYTCSSFLAREMIRYAESEAIYTFVVETESYGGTSSRCILLHMLSWDTIIGTVDSDPTRKYNDRNVSYQKVLKVIFEERANFHGVSDNPMDWKWGNLDLCCPPPIRSDETSSMERRVKDSPMNMLSNVNAPTKATSVRICLAANEWHELKHSLMSRSLFFSESVRDAVVMTKLGVLPEKEGVKHAALLSFLPIVT